MPDLDKIAKAFRLFNEKAEKLARLSFLEKMDDPNAGFTLSFKNLEEGGSEVRQERRGPEEEAIDAFVLTFRFFIQDNEPSSFRQMAEHYNAAPIEQDLKDKFTKVRENINTYLDTPVNINYNHEELTCRRIIYVYIYGGLSHADEAKRRLHKTWVNDPYMGKFIEHIFVSSLANIHDAIAYIKKLNEEALKSLPGPS
jgi:hypothetical protein